jgi:hypothetical protein
MLSKKKLKKMLHNQIVLVEKLMKKSIVTVLKNLMEKKMLLIIALRIILLYHVENSLPMDQPEFKNVFLNVKEL